LLAKSAKVSNTVALNYSKPFFSSQLDDYEYNTWHHSKELIYCTL